MVIAREADTDRAMNRVLALTAYVCCGLVIASFALFARDQLAGASKNQQTEINTGGAQAGSSGTPTVHHHAQPRRFIDGAASALTSPFRSLVHSDSAWVTHGVSTFLALLVYGAGLGFLARYSRGWSGAAVGHP
jgi:hypothetical protein